MLDIYICEDNTAQREFAANFITEYCKMKKLPVSVTLASPIPAQILSHSNNRNNPALYFLDIDLNTDINGIELARQIRESTKPSQKVFIVFLTARTELTMMTFQYKVEAMDFIAKDRPSDMKARIAECIKTALERMDVSVYEPLQIVVNDQLMKVNIDEIVLIETTHVRHKLRLHTQNRMLEFNGELKKVEEQLDERFIRSHKSYLINKDKIVSINKKENTLTMSNNSICPLSRNGKKWLT